MMTCIKEWHLNTGFFNQTWVRCENQIDADKIL